MLDMKKSEFNKKNNLKYRTALLGLLGDKCIKCGFSDTRALQVDHINGGGSRERTEKGSRAGNNYYILKEIMCGKLGKYQLLCANCNWIKRSENNEVRVK